MQAHLDLASLGSIVLLLIFDIAVKVAALTVAMVVLFKLGRIRNISIRHYTWAGLLAVMLALPISMFLVPSKSVPILPAGLGANPEATTFQKARSSLVSSNNPNAGSIDIASSVASTEINPATGMTPSSAVRIAPWSANFKRNLPIYLVLIYLAGAGLMFIRLGVGFVLSNRILSKSRRVERADLSRFIGELLPATTLRSTPSIWTCSGILVPLTTGWLRGRILLPEGWEQWDKSKLEAVLAHEISHIRRYDHLLNLMAAINRCIYWFHPVAWILPKQLSQLAEQASDDSAILVAGNRKQYATHLLEVASALEHQSGRLRFTGPGMVHSSELSRRIDAILDADRALAIGLSGIRRFFATSLIVVTIFLLAIPHFANRPNGITRVETARAASTRELLPPSLIDISGNRLREPLSARSRPGTTVVAPSPAKTPVSAPVPHLVLPNSAASARPNLPQTSEVTKDETFTDRTEIREYTLTLGEATKFMRLNIKALAHSGLIRWALIDPAGTKRCSIATTDKAEEDETSLPLIEGTWLLRIELRNASGNYQVRWTAR